MFPERKQDIRSLLRQIYVGLRKLTRSLIIGNSFLDQALGDPLRRLERRLRPHEHLRVVSPSVGGQVHTRGCTLIYRPEDKGVVTSLLLYGDYEPETTNTILESLRPGMTFVDLGAHIGYYTVLAAKAVSPTGHVYGFEPVESTCEILRSNITLNRVDGTTTIVPKAIWERSGLVRLHISPESSVSSRIRVGGNILGTQSCAEIEAVSLDDFFREEGWPTVHLVKMDIEGAELRALQGMRELGSRNPELKLIMEFNYPRLVELKIHPEQVFEALYSCGFSRFRVLKRHAEHLKLSGDIPQLVALAQRVTVNLPCEK